MRGFPIHHARLRYGMQALLLAALAAAGTATAEPTPYEARVIAPGANVHSGPGENFYPTDTLAQGDVVEVHREQPGGWLGIRPPESSFSWVFGLHVKRLKGPLAEVDKDDVASRLGSRLGNQRNAVQVRLKKGETVEIIGEETLDGQKWYKIAPPSGEFRWIHAQNIERVGRPSQAEVPVAPVVTVPVPGAPAVAADPAVTLVADSQPQAETDWRAAPVERAKELTDSPSAIAPSAVATPPAATASDAQADANITAEAAPSADSTSTSGAPPTVASATPDAGTTQQATARISDGLARELTDVELRLSRIVAEPPLTWHIEPLRQETEQLLARASDQVERAAINSTLAKLARFAAIAQRYQQAAAASTPPGQTPITPIPYGAGSEDPRTTGLGDPRTTAGVAADRKRYDATGILRPVVSKRPGAPQFALVDDRGQVISFVTPTPDVNLQPYLGHRIGVTGSRGYIPEFQRAHVTAGRVSPLVDRIVR